MASRRIEDLHFQFQPLVKEFLKKANEFLKSKGWEIFITDGYRSFEEQAGIFAQGRTTPGKIVSYAMPGWSWHNYRLAVDIAFRNEETPLEYNLPELYQEVGRIGKEMEFTWGGDFTIIVDRPHFEWHPNMTIEQALKLKDLSNYDFLKGGEKVVGDTTETDEFTYITNIRNFFKEKGINPDQWEPTIRGWAESDKKLKENIPGDMKSRDDEIGKLKKENEDLKKEVEVLKKSKEIDERVESNETLNEDLKAKDVKVFTTLVNLFNKTKEKVVSPRDFWNAVERFVRVLGLLILGEYFFYLTGNEEIKRVLQNFIILQGDSALAYQQLLIPLVAGLFKYLRDKKILPSLIPRIPL
jgi:peptidoglycan L-alanyl-D-glutamate endopeptidase CwlK